jgi:hypothetical protein
MSRGIRCYLDLLPARVVNSARNAFLLSQLCTLLESMHALKQGSFLGIPEVPHAR